MEQKIFEYVSQHPVLASIIIPIVLGIILSFAIELFKYILYGNNDYIGDEKVKQDKTDNIVFRLITVAIAIVCALLVLDALGDAIQTFALKALFVILNTSVPFAFYHLKGRELIRIVINKLFAKFKKTDL